MNKQKFDEGRHALVQALKGVQEYGCIEEAMELFIHLGRKTMVNMMNLNGRKRSVPMDTYLACALEKGMAETPMRRNVIVHMNWPINELTGRNQLVQLAVERLNANAIRESEHEAMGQRIVRVVQSWIQDYRNRMLGVVEDNAIFLEHQYKAAETDAVPTVGGNDVMGYMNARAFSDYIQRHGGIHPDAELEFSGASLGCCPTHVARQTLAAWRMGIFLPPDPQLPGHKTKGGLDTKTYETAWQMMTLALTRSGIAADTRFSTGVMMDSLGMKKRIAAAVPHAEQEPYWPDFLLTKQIMRGDEREAIVPQDEEMAA